MNEDFLQYLWKYKKFKLSNLQTTHQEEVILQHVGTHNTKNSGPDFFNAQIIINNQKWAGNVEIHIKTSDWYLHNHQNDNAYDNVILHVVWEDDVEIYRKDNTLIPTVQLKDYISVETLARYQKLFNRADQESIPCKNELAEVSSFVISNWQERLYFERLEQKSVLILKLLKDSANDWESVLFQLLSKNFGLKMNGEAFMSVAKSIDFSILRKCIKNHNQLEALFFGQAGFLEHESEIAYVKKLQSEYHFLKYKFKLERNSILPFEFFRLRPSNFPTIRIAQLAGLYFNNQKLFRDIISTNTLSDFYSLFDVATSSFWQNRYTFEKESTPRTKRLTKSFIDLILINTIVPIKFVYAKSLGKNSEDELLDLISQIAKEKNSIVEQFSKHKVPVSNAMHSQAMIQLKNVYCDQKACLKCAIGNYLLNQD